MFLWDEAKAAANFTKHGVKFDAVYDFDWETADISIDDRKDYVECRWRAFGVIRDKLYALVYTIRDDTIRIISLRRANKREEKRYETRPPN